MPQKRGQAELVVLPRRERESAPRGAMRDFKKAMTSYGGPPHGA